MQMVVSPNIVPLQLDQELNSKKMMYYFKYDKQDLHPSPSQVQICVPAQ